ncbi:hypothetical protein FNV66_53010 [Streptomyces sp. S1D4-14]|nr:hypothetical protein FNV66_53010 [Streptomyces sp. S1D4-14]
MPGLLIPPVPPVPSGLSRPCRPGCPARAVRTVCPARAARVVRAVRAVRAVRVVGAAGGGCVVRGGCGGWRSVGWALSPGRCRGGAGPPGLVDRVVAACGRSEHRRRLLPARLVVYFVLALALFSPAPYLEVMRHLVEGLRGRGLLGEWHIPAKSSLFRARQRLGSEPLRVLFATTAKPMGTQAAPGCFWRGLRLLAVDATCWDVADSPANEAAFGRPGNSSGHDKSCFPQVRMACLIEVGTHLVLDAELAGCRTGEVTLVNRLPILRTRSTHPGRPGVLGRAVVAGLHQQRCRSVVAGARQPGPARRPDAA